MPVTCHRVKLTVASPVRRAWSVTSSGTASESTAWKSSTLGDCVVGSLHEPAIATVGAALLGVLLFSVIVNAPYVPPAVGRKVTTRFDAVPGATVSGFGKAEK